ncbi:MAG: NHLP leader peptide family RiPP precursor, partial [Bacteroidales bacterium]
DFEQSLDSRLAAYRQLVLKAEQDPAFREQLKADPVRALKEAFGLDWAPSIKLEVIEESADRCVLVLPKVLPAANDDELSDDELEAVAAGTGSDCSQSNGYNKN